MRIVPFIISGLITIALILFLNTRWLAPLPFGSFLSPQHGFWQNAEPADEDFSGDLSFPQLNGKVDVYFDDRLVPHIFAENENDAYFVQGFLHAKFRLWQMELQVLSAEGRISELVGDRALDHDRDMRRLGMKYAAENSLKQVENDPEIRAQCDSYTAGINAYVETLTDSRLPIEYKLLGYYPEKWSNLKTALFLKYMSYDLTAHSEDMELTNARKYFSNEDFNLLYPLVPDSSDPVIPKGTVYPAPSIQVKPPVNPDSITIPNTVININMIKPDRDNGSNNWAVNGKKTQSGYPILANDPHLGLNLPSLWFEVHISTPAFNAYGVSFPGAPGVIIGFNDSCAFGFTNGGRDVLDYYEIRFKDDTRSEYWFNNEWKKTEFRYETIKIKGRPDFIDTVAYTVFGPVRYDRNFTGGKTSGSSNYAVRWKAHDASNELRMFNMLDHAKNYSDYNAAAIYLHTPGQNCVFATKTGDIALRAQGEFPAKWKGQGDFVMPGMDSSYMWQGNIPMNEVPFQYNPERNFVSSANQVPADGYPYYFGRGFPNYRGILINHRLSAMNNITVDDIKNLQTDNYNEFGEMAVPVLLRNINDSVLNADEKKYLNILRSWNYRNDVGSKGATVFFVTWEYFEDTVWNDEFAKGPKVMMKPYESTLLEAILRDSAFKFLDNINTPQKETLKDITTAAFKRAVIDLKEEDAAGRLDWEKSRNKQTRITHLLRLDPFSRLNVPVGGGTHCINATKFNHGPSWRMIVSLTPQTEAYGVYPGGQSGNPGSKYYDNFIDTWAAGKYYSIWVMKKEEVKDKRVIGVMHFSK